MIFLIYSSILIFNFEKYFDNLIISIDQFFNKKLIDIDEILQDENQDIKDIADKIVDEYKILMNKSQENLKDYYSQFISSVEKIYEALAKYIGFENKNMDYRISANMDVDAHIGSLVGKVGLYAGTFLGLGAVSAFFPPLFLVTIPASLVISWFLGGNIIESFKKVVSKKARFIDALKNIQKSQIEEYKLIKKRFIRDLEEKKQNIEENTKSLINIKTLELSSKSKETKEFYSQLKNDYESLLKNMKNQFNIN